MTYITISAKDKGSFQAYLAKPQGKQLGSVIVIQEIFGVNEGIREKCDWLARHGFMACAPDLFWRIEPGIELSDQVPEELERAFELFGLFDVDQGVEDLQAVHHVLKGHEDGNGKVGCLGYCLGGKLAYLMGCRGDLEASIGYYGVGIEGLLAEANNISSPVLLHMAQKDQFVPPDAQRFINEGLKDNDFVTLHTYEDMDHAFTRVGGDHYDANQAQIADQRSIEFLSQTLK